MPASSEIQPLSSKTGVILIVQLDIVVNGIFSDLCALTLGCGYITLLYRADESH